MCYVINSSNLLMNYFANSKKKQISFLTLKKLKVEIETVLEKQVYVDITRDSISNIFLGEERYKAKGTYIEIERSFEKILHQKRLDQVSNDYLPEKIKKKYQSVLSEFLNNER